MNKWGRAAFAAGIIALCISLGSCGSDAKENNPITSDGTENASSAVSSSIKTNSELTPIERLAGKFHIDGDRNAASVVIESDGSFTAYYASGTAEQTGYVRYEADESGFHVYVFYTDEGKPYMGFVDSGESIISEFETGNGSYRYVRAE